MTDDGLDALLASLTLSFPGGRGVRVPYGLAFALPQEDRDGDPITVYVAAEGGRMRVVDDGQTIPLLSAAGDEAGVAGTIRAAAEAGFLYDAQECELHSPWLTPEAVSTAVQILAEILQAIGRRDGERTASSEAPQASEFG